MTFAEAKKELESKLLSVYDKREAQSIAGLVMETAYGMDKIEWFLKKNNSISPGQLQKLHEDTAQLLLNRPVQYVLNEAWFMGMPFMVREGVLIPRPETEELVDWIKSFFIEQKSPISILDIGTGSGCIAISLDKILKNKNVTGFDISSDALAIAKENNQKLSANVLFQQKDILIGQAHDYSQIWDVIVSNPPYIRTCEKKEMEANVLQYEPSTALFVTDEDPLLFYRKIAELGRYWLKSGGYLFFEINESFGKEIVGLLSDIGYQAITLKKDIQGKNRMVKALWLVN